MVIGMGHVADRAHCNRNGTRGSILLIFGGLSITLETTSGLRSRPESSPRSFIALHYVYLCFVVTRERERPRGCL